MGSVYLFDPGFPGYCREDAAGWPEFPLAAAAWPASRNVTKNVKNFVNNSVKSVLRTMRGNLEIWKFSRYNISLKKLLFCKFSRFFSSSKIPFFEIFVFFYLQFLFATLHLDGDDGLLLGDAHLEAEHKQLHSSASGWLSKIPVLWHRILCLFCEYNLFD